MRKERACERKRPENDHIINICSSRLHRYDTYKKTRCETSGRFPPGCLRSSRRSWRQTTRISFKTLLFNSDTKHFFCFLFCFLFLSLSSKQPLIITECQSIRSCCQRASLLKMCYIKCCYDKKSCTNFLFLFYFIFCIKALRFSCLVVFTYIHNCLHGVGAGVVWHS